MQNREAGIPLFGWEPHAPEKLRAERVAEWRKLHQSKRYIAAEAELWSAIAMAVDIYKAFYETKDAEDEAFVDGSVLDLLENYINSYPQFDRPERDNYN